MSVKSKIQLAKELGVTRSKTALKIYQESVREKFMEENEHLSARDVRKALSSRFDSMEEEERAKYFEQEKEDRARFLQELNAEMAKAGMEPLKLPAKKEKKAKRVTIAKALNVAPPKSAFHFFNSKTRPSVVKKNPDMAPKDVLKHLSTLWNGLATTKKTKFQKLAVKDKARYEKELEKAKEEHPEIVEQNKKDNAALRKLRRELRKKDPASSVKRPKSAYVFFCNKMRSQVKEENPDMKSVDVQRELAKLWKKTTDRAVYQEQAAADKLRYAKEVEEAKKAAEETAAEETADEKTADEEADEEAEETADEEADEEAEETADEEAAEDVEEEEIEED